MDRVVYDRIEDVLSAIEYNGGGISELLGKGVVKSVQRGTASVPSVGTPKDYTIDISPVDVNKSIALVGGGVIEAGNGVDYMCNVTIKSLISTALTIRIKNANFSNPKTATVGWQVIEFY